MSFMQWSPNAFEFLILMKKHPVSAKEYLKVGKPVDWYFKKYY